MNRLPFFLVCVAAAAAGCAKDSTFSEPLLPHAGITWLNGVSDTGQLDIRVIDIPSNAGFADMNFRGGSMYPLAIEAGQRRLKVFMSSGDPVIAQQYIVDTTYNFVADQDYTFYISGFARVATTPRPRAVIIPSNPPAPGAGQIAIRVLNLAPSFAGAALPDTTVAADAFVRKVNAAAGGAPGVTNLAYLGASTYTLVDTGRYAVGLTATGVAGPLFVEAAVPTGVLGTTTSNPIGGSRVAGSVITAVIMPRSVATSTAPQGGRPSLRSTDTTAAEASRRISRSNDTVTVQTGSVSILTNRSPTKPDSTVGGTGTRASAGVARGDVAFISGATEAEYNGWQAVLAGSGALGAAGVADTLLCNPVDTDTTGGADTRSRCNAVNAVATTRFRFQFRVLGTPASPGTGSPQYRVYPALDASGIQATDFTIPFIMFVVDRRPPNTVP
jgi:hypothetical protein